MQKKVTTWEKKKSQERELRPATIMQRTNVIYNRAQVLLDRSKGLEDWGKGAHLEAAKNLTLVRVQSGGINEKERNEQAVSRRGVRGLDSRYFISSNWTPGSRIRVTTKMSFQGNKATERARWVVTRSILCPIESGGPTGRVRVGALGGGKGCLNGVVANLYQVT